jgi:ABC-type multidrug transport system fused ATPase/permease subunit
MIERFSNASVMPKHFSLWTEREVKSALWPILRHYVWSLPIVTVLGFAGSALEGLGIGLLVPLLTGLLGSSDANSGALSLGLLTKFTELFDPDIRLAAISFTILALVMVKGVVQALNWTFISWVTGQIGHRIRHTLCERLLTFGYPFFLGQEPARLVTIVATESWRVSDAVRMVFSLVTAFAAVMAYSVLLFTVNWKLFLAVLVGVIIIRLVQSLYAKRLGEMSKGVADANRGLAERMLQVVNDTRLIRIFVQEEREQKSFARASEQVRQAVYAVERASAYVGPMQEVLLTIVFIGVLLGANAAGMSASVTIAFLVLLQRMQPHLLIVSRSWLGIASLRASIAEVEWLLDPRGKPAPPSGALLLEHFSGPITFDNVSFAYPSRTEGAALSNVSFTIHERGSTALIGRSGAGKTTIVNMLCRLIEPTEGKITVSGVDLANIDPNTWRKKIGLASQDIDLIEGSIAENIAYGHPGASFTEIVEAAKIADADTFIQALPEGYDTRIGSRGIGLSGGQRQRIGFARALVKKPDILILDEATNAVDGLSEQNIMSILRDRSCYKTAIVISHRQSTLACCEHGIVLEGGQVVESGPLESLKFYQGMALSERSS